MKLDLYCADTNRIHNLPCSVTNNCMLITLTNQHTQNTVVSTLDSIGIRASFMSRTIKKPGSDFNSEMFHVKSFSDVAIAINQVQTTTTSTQSYIIKQKSEVSMTLFGSQIFQDEDKRDFHESRFILECWFIMFNKIFGLLIFIAFNLRNV